MILGGRDDRAPAQGLTLDDLFRRAGVRRPDAVALVDPPNRAAFTDGAPRRLTFAQADRAIGCFAARLRGLGLPTDTVVAVQLANTVEWIIALLGILRAGMIPAPLPQLWRRRDIVTALACAGAKAIVTTARIGGHPHAETAMQAAVEHFPIRYVCAFGHELPDGVVPLDGDVAVTAEAFPHLVRPGEAAAHAALVTFEVTTGGMVAVARNHAQLIAGGLAVFLQAGLAAQGTIVSAIPPATFAGAALTLLPWLIGGGTLHLRHGFDPEGFAETAGGAMVLPGPAVTPLHRSDVIDKEVHTVLGLWRAPERLTSATAWREDPRLIDIACFGEIGLVGLPRDDDGLPNTLPLGPIVVARNGSEPLAAIETTRLETGALGLRGAMVPTEPFPPGADLGPPPHLALTDDGYIDTGYSCRIEGDGLVISGPPAALTSVGAYRFAARELDAAVAEIDPGATIISLPDALIGERLAGAAGEPETLRADLQSRGANPLIADAFRRRTGNAA